MVIERQGAELRMRPAQRRLGDVLGSLASILEDVPVAAFEAAATNAYGPIRLASLDSSRPIWWGGFCQFGQQTALPITASCCR